MIEKKKRSRKKKKAEDIVDQITIAIAADSIATGNKYYSATNSRIGTIRFGYIGDNPSSASSSLRFFSFSMIGDNFSSVSANEHYYCNSIGDEISSCRGGGKSIYFSVIGNNVSSSRTLGGDYIGSTNVYYSSSGDRLTSATSIEIGAFSIR